MATPPFDATLCHGAVPMALGIDVGGSTIKGAVVHLRREPILASRRIVSTPSPATPDSLAQVVGKLVSGLRWNGAIGCGFPAALRGTVVHAVANLDPAWANTNCAEVLRQATGRWVCVLNDADAAGLAEIRYGSARSRRGVVMVVTFGTGIGTALFLEGHLIPNTEFGHLRIAGAAAERYCSARTRTVERLSLHEWSARVNEYLAHLEQLLAPDLFIIGGGISEQAESFLSSLRLETEVRRAALGKDAGIVGAALAATEASGAGASWRPADGAALS